MLNGRDAISAGRPIDAVGPSPTCNSKPASKINRKSATAYYRPAPTVLRAAAISPRSAFSAET